MSSNVEPVIMEEVHPRRDFKPICLLDCSLFAIGVPIELRYIIKIYYCGFPYYLTDKSFHIAVRTWLCSRELGWLRYGHIRDWDTSRVTNMAYAFCVETVTALTPDIINDNSTISLHTIDPKTTTMFNEYINEWDVSNVVNMEGMFHECAMFNQPLNEWNTHNVVNMKHMFHNAASFNQYLNTWNTSKVEAMGYMFCRAASFNQCIDRWDTSSVGTMRAMFAGASVFNQPIGCWDVHKVKNMASMFEEAHCFNQPVGKWNVGNVKEMHNMFHEAFVFNQPLEDWDVHNVILMSGMFHSAFAFNQSLNGWRLQGVVLTNKMFYNASSFDAKNHIATWRSQSSLTTTSSPLLDDAPAVDPTILTPSLTGMGLLPWCEAMMDYMKAKWKQWQVIASHQPLIAFNDDVVIYWGTIVGLIPVIIVYNISVTIHAYRQEMVSWGFITFQLIVIATACSVIHWIKS